jgi:hypothetical protein
MLAARLVDELQLPELRPHAVQEAGALHKVVKGLWHRLGGLLPLILQRVERRREGQLGKRAAWAGVQLAHVVKARLGAGQKRVQRAGDKHGQAPTAFHRQSPDELGIAIREHTDDHVARRAARPQARPLQRARRHNLPLIWRNRHPACTATTKGR